MATKSTAIAGARVVATAVVDPATPTRLPAGAATATAAAAAVLACLVAPVANAADLKVIVHDTAGQPLTDAVIYVEPADHPLKPPTQPPHAIIDQVNKRFVPLVSIVQTGTEVSFPNSDNIRHSIYSFSAPKVFTTKLYSGRQAPPVVFDKPGVVVLGCNIHDTMVAWVVVVDTPYFAKSDAAGAGTIRDLEPGEYRLTVWYPQPQFNPVISRVKITATGAESNVTVDASASTLPALRKPAGS